MNNQFACVVTIAWAALLSGCSTAEVTKRTDLGSEAVAPPAKVYVADFDLPATNVHSHRGLVSRLEGALQPLSGPPRDPQDLSEYLVTLMADSIVRDLNAAALPAERLRPGSPLPTRGWLIRGIFTNVNEGKQVLRAVVGLGKGKTEVQVTTAVDNLSEGPPQPFYQVVTDAKSGNAPGAGPAIVTFPLLAAGQYVLSGRDLVKNTKQTASAIATELEMRVRAAKAARGNPPMAIGGRN